MSSHHSKLILNVLNSGINEVDLIERYNWSFVLQRLKFKLTQQSKFGIKIAICKLTFFLFLYWNLLLLMILAKNPYDREKLTRPEDYSKALYTFDIGQNDLAVGFRKLSIDQLRAALPDIANQFASAIQVSRRKLTLLSHRAVSLSFLISHGVVCHAVICWCGLFSF